MRLLGGHEEGPGEEQGGGERRPKPPVLHLLHTHAHKHMKRMPCVKWPPPRPPLTPENARTHPCASIIALLTARLARWARRWGAAPPSTGLLPATACCCSEDCPAGQPESLRVSMWLAGVILNDLRMDWVSGAEGGS